MRELTNPRYERFAQELAAGNSADGAYEAAGYRKHRGNAARLSSRNSVNRGRAGCCKAVEAEVAALLASHAAVRSAICAAIKSAF